MADAPSSYCIMFLTVAAPAQASAHRATHIVQLRGGVSPAEGGAIVRAAGGEVTGALPIINGVAARLSPNAQKRLAADGRIARVNVNARTFSTRMSSIRPPRDLDPSRLETAYPFSVLAPQSWAKATGEGVGVAVIDTGIDGACPDFADENGDSRVVAVGGDEPGREDGRRHLRSRHARRGHHRR